MINGLDTNNGAQLIYDDFVVPAGGWAVPGVFSNGVRSGAVPATAFWEIRSGTSTGNAGTLIASGTDSETVTATGRTFFGFPEDTFAVNGLNVFLAPGTYWLVVAPVNNGGGQTGLSISTGTNAVGNPPGNDGNSFFTYDGSGIQSMTSFEGGPTDFSEGVIINQTPAPASMFLTAAAAGLLLAVVRRRMQVN